MKFLLSWFDYLKCLTALKYKAATSQTAVLWPVIGKKAVKMCSYTHSTQTLFPPRLWLSHSPLEALSGSSNFCLVLERTTLAAAWISQPRFGRRKETRQTTRHQLSDQCFQSWVRGCRYRWEGGLEMRVWTVVWCQSHSEIHCCNSVEEPVPDDHLELPGADRMREN